MRSRPLPEREKEIGLRLRIWRETLGYSRARMVEGMRVSPQKLAHVEEGNAPLRYDFARLIRSGFAISPRWLATGQGLTYSDEGSDELPAPQELGINARELFSSVFDSKLAARESASGPTIAASPSPAPQFDIETGSRVMAQRWFQQKAQAWLENVPDIMISDFAQELANRADELIALYSKRREKILKLYPKKPADFGKWNAKREIELRRVVHRPEE